jgi:hypothetical protein
LFSEDVINITIEQGGLNQIFLQNATIAVVAMRDCNRHRTDLDDAPAEGRLKTGERLRGEMIQPESADTIVTCMGND